MSQRCALCGKGKMIGRQHRHHKGVAGGKWIQRAQSTVKVNKPNLHVFNGVLAGQKSKWLLCTKCLRKVKSNLLKPIKEEILPANKNGSRKTE